MKRGGGVPHRNDDNEAKIGGVTNKKKMKKNMQRLGGRGGLSLASFANAKARNDTYNPSVISMSLDFSNFFKKIASFSILKLEIRNRLLVLFDVISTLKLLGVIFSLQSRGLQICNMNVCLGSYIRTKNGNFC